MEGARLAISWNGEIRITFFRLHSLDSTKSNTWRPVLDMESYIIIHKTACNAKWLSICIILLSPIRDQEVESKYPFFFHSRRIFRLWMICSTWTIENESPHKILRDSFLCNSPGPKIQTIQSYMGGMRIRRNKREKEKETEKKSKYWN